MTTLTQRELDELLLQYDEWLRNDAAGKSPVFAGMDLSGLELKKANLYHADFRGCTLFYFPACPCEGSFIGYKKAVTESGYAIVRLYIPEDAKRNSATSYRCRADRASGWRSGNLTRTDGMRRQRESTFICQKRSPCCIRKGLPGVVQKEDGHVREISHR